MKEKKDNLIALLAERNSLNEKIHTLKQEIADAITPYKIGDTVTINGYYHNGKKCIINSYYLTENSTGLGFKVRGDVLKKDGSLSNFKCEWSDYQDAALKAVLHQLLTS